MKKNTIKSPQLFAATTEMTDFELDWHLSSIVLNVEIHFPFVLRSREIGASLIIGSLIWHASVRFILYPWLVGRVEIELL